MSYVIANGYDVEKCGNLLLLENPYFGARLQLSYPIYEMVLETRDGKDSRIIQFSKEIFENLVDEGRTKVEVPLSEDVIVTLTNGLSSSD